MNKRELNDLMIKVQCGDEIAFSSLFESCKKGVFSFIYTFVNDYQIAEDLLQETFIKLKQSAYLYKPDTNASAYLLQIAKNTAIDYLRKEKQNVNLELNEKTPAKSEDITEKLYLHKIINDTLPQGERQILILHLEYGYKMREIAKILNIPLGTALWKYNKSLKALKKAIENQDENFRN